MIDDNFIDDLRLTIYELLLSFGLKTIRLCDRERSVAGSNTEIVIKKAFGVFDYFTFVRNDGLRQ